MAGNDAMLIGRRTYDEFASFWPSADPDDPYTAQMNGTRKYVVSTTLTSPEWENCTVVSGDVRAELARLKQDNNLGTTGSGILVRWLPEQGLVDELHPLIHPLVVGKGRKLLDGEGTQGTAGTAIIGDFHHGYHPRGLRQPGQVNQARQGVAESGDTLAGRQRLCTGADATLESSWRQPQTFGDPWEQRRRWSHAM